MPDYSFRVSQEQSNLIGAALAELPWKHVADLMGSLKQQALAQEEAWAAEEKAKQAAHANAEALERDLPDVARAA